MGNPQFEFGHFGVVFSSDLLFSVVGKIRNTDLHHCVGWGGGNRWNGGAAGLLENSKRAPSSTSSDAMKFDMF